MSLLSLQEVTVAFGAQDVLRGITGEIDSGDRIGLVGRNGAGKTTLLRLLAGESRPDRGQIHVATGVTRSLVEQLPRDSDSDETVYGEAISALADVINLERAIDRAAHALSEGAPGADREYADLMQQFEAIGGYSYRNRLSQVLLGLGLPESDWPRPVKQLSGGQRTRLGLAKALLAQPGLLLLDEPTNHIDIDAMIWLDGLLARWPGTIVVTSHDRYFLDKVATRIWLLEDGKVRAYRGNYSQFEALRRAEIELQTRQARAQQGHIAKEEAFIRRYRAGQRAREAQGRLKKLGHIERIDTPVKQRSTSFRLAAGRSGERVLATDGLVVGYEAEGILDVGAVEVARGERIALIGANGSGKTSLLRTIAGELEPVAGNAQMGAAVTLGHYWQEAENLDSKSTVFEELRKGRSLEPQAVRNILGRFLFGGDDVAKPVSALSGGERSRLALARLMLLDANLLLLDEPTNHLDIPARESLQDALDAFKGTIIFVSHDRRLIADLATSLWRIEDGRLLPFAGTFAEYMELSSVEPPEPKPAKAVAPRRVPAATKTSQVRRAAIENLERDIEAVEAKVAELGGVINEASARSDSRAVATLGLEFEAAQVELGRLMREWEETAL